MDSHSGSGSFTSEGDQSGSGQDGGGEEADQDQSPYIEMKSGDKLIEFMYKVSAVQQREIAALVFENMENPEDHRFVLLPWDDNIQNDSRNHFPELVNLYRDLGYMDVAQVHTHNSDNRQNHVHGISLRDYKTFSNWGIREMYIIEHDGTIFGMTRGKRYILHFDNGTRVIQNPDKYTVFPY